MLRTVRDACEIHSMVHDYRMTEAIENLSDLIAGEGDGAEFFARGHQAPVLISEHLGMKPRAVKRPGPADHPKTTLRLFD